jgi:ribose 5-phosphate isomerase B
MKPTSDGYQIRARRRKGNLISLNLRNDKLYSGTGLSGKDRHQEASSMKIVIGSDHAGFKVKERLKKLLQEWGHQVIDMGTGGEESCDYPDFAEKVARAVASGQGERGVLLCGTGIGMAMTANRIPGALAATVHDRVTAEMSRKHNNANIFCAGAWVLPAGEIESNLRVWLETPFEGGRHERRVGKILKLDRAK